MNNYSVVIWVNGAFALHSEHPTAIAAEIEYYSYVAAVLSEAEQAEEYHATIKVLDYQLDNYHGLSRTINKVKEPVAEKPAAE